MEEIKEFVELIITQTGVQGSAVPILRYILLILVAVFLGWFAGWICRKLLPLLKKLTSRIGADWANVLLNEKMLSTTCQIVPAIVVWKLLPLVFFQTPRLMDFVARLTLIYIAVMVAKWFVQLLNFFNQIKWKNGTATRQYMYSFTGVLKIIVIFFTVIIIVSLLINRNPTTLIAGLGAASAVLMLVFKDTIEGLVAGIRLTSNEMIQVGDWITVPGTLANGIVTQITLTTVKVQNFDNTIVTVAPKTLVDGSFQNWKGLDEADGRLASKSVNYDFGSIKIVDAALKGRLVSRGYYKAEEIKPTDTNVTLFRQFVERKMVDFDLINTDMTYMVRQLQPTTKGLPVEFYFFVKNKEWKTYEHHASSVMEWIYAISKEFDLTIYQEFPMQKENAL